MELDWTTFILEIVNFLILVWILQRFLYKPILGVISRRQAAIEASMQDARLQDAKAKELMAQYESRLQVWEQERDKARAALREDLAVERTRLLGVLQEEIERERARAAAVDEKERRAHVARAEGVALEHATGFVSRLLERLATPELEAKLVEVAIEDLSKLGPSDVAAIRSPNGQPTQKIGVTTAFPLPAPQQAALRSALETLLAAPHECEFAVDPALIAGVRVIVGPWSLRANLVDELKAFRDAALSI